jgi:hypothetical protein
VASIYLDNDVAFPLATLLRSRGHEVTTTLELGRTRAHDHLQLLLAAHNAWLLVTHNRRDFILLHDAWRLWSEYWQITPRHGGIVVLPQNQHWTVRDMSRQLDILFAGGYPLVNEFYDWRVQGAWVRRPYTGVAAALHNAENH